MTFTIRTIQPQDNARLAAIIRQVLTEFGANRPGFAWADPELDALAEAYQGEQSVYLVVTVAGAIAGGAGLAPFPCAYPGICELQKMYLLPEYRGQELGQALMTRLLQRAAAMGYRGCYLETLDAMQQALGLYEKFGFQRLSQPLGNSGHSSCNRFYGRWLAGENPNTEAPVSFCDNALID
jgi:putative acetyltransferase